MSGHQPVLAVDLGGTSVRAEVHGEGASVLAEARRLLPPRPAPGDEATCAETDAVLAAVVHAARDALAQLEPGLLPAVEAVGLVIPGLVDAEAGVSVYSTNLGWRDVPVAARVEAALGLPVALAHDVRSAGEAELRLGSARGLRDVLVVVIGTGISSVVVANGLPVEGLHGQAGEIGHIVVRPDGPACGCGRNGCLEAVASAGALSRRYAERTGRAVPGAAAVAALLPGDEVAAALWTEAAEAIGDVILSVCALLAPTTVVIGGGLAESGELLLGPVRERLRSRATIEPLPEIRRAAFGARAGLVGAGLIARRRLEAGVR